MQVDQLIRDPFLSLTESQCILQAKNYTLTVANANGSPPANVWNFCATGICNYTFVNGTSGRYISPYAGSHTASTCQLGYSAAVDRNEYVEPAYIQLPGQGSAGEGGRAVLCRAVLCYAVLCCAVLCCEVLCCDVMCCAVLCCAVLGWAGLHVLCSACHDKPQCACISLMMLYSYADMWVVACMTSRC